MRMGKVLGVAVLVAVVGGVAAIGVAAPIGRGVPFGGAASGAEDSVAVNASFSIPSWISLSVQGNGDVSFASITGPGSYNGSNGTTLRVLSTTSWSISSEILFKDSTMPKGASESTIEDALSMGFDKTNGSWGIHTVKVSYEFELDEDDMGDLPEGDYNLVVQYTATTD
jgi:hypothetical protein